MIEQMVALYKHALDPEYSILECFRMDNGVYVITFSHPPTDNWAHVMAVLAPKDLEEEGKTWHLK